MRQPGESAGVLASGPRVWSPVHSLAARGRGTPAAARQDGEQDGDRRGEDGAEPREAPVVHDADCRRQRGPDATSSDDPGRQADDQATTPTVSACQRTGGAQLPTDKANDPEHSEVVSQAGEGSVGTP